MDSLDALQLGFGVALTRANLLAVGSGALLGALAARWIGLGPQVLIAMLLPALPSLDAMPALVLLAGVYCGAQYRGSTRATVVIGSFFAACVGTLVLAAAAPPLAVLALRLGPAELFALGLLALASTLVLAPGALLKAIAMIVLGLLLGQVGTEAISGLPRYGFGIAELAGGFGLVALAIGIFGFGEIIASLARPAAPHEPAGRGSARGRPTRRALAQATPALLRGTALGSLLGLLPGGGARLAAFAAGAFEDRLAARRVLPPPEAAELRRPAAAQAAGCAGAQAALVPALTLGIPANAAIAMIIGAMSIKAILPGAQLATRHAPLFWGLIAALWLAQAMLLLMHLPLAAMRGGRPSRPSRLLLPAVVVLLCIGSYVAGQRFGVLLTAAFALLGHLLFKLGCAPAPLLLGFVVGPMMEDNLRGALLLSNGNWSAFVTRPLSAALLGATGLLLLLAAMLPTLRSRRRQVFGEG